MFGKTTDSELVGGRRHRVETAARLVAIERQAQIWDPLPEPVQNGARAGAGAQTERAEKIIKEVMLLRDIERQMPSAPTGDEVSRVMQRLIRGRLNLGARRDTARALLREAAKSERRGILDSSDAFELMREEISYPALPF